MIFTPTKIPEVILVKPKVFQDDRGYFFEAFKESEFQQHGMSSSISQESQSFSKNKFTLRGLHYQKDPKAQGKILRVLKGRIFDVAVDIRVGSPTYGQWVSETLTDEGKEQLWIPIGFAHGFMTLEDNCEIAYKIYGGEYAPELEASIIWNDPRLNINWPSQQPILSSKDSISSTLEEADNNFIYQKG